MQKALSSVLVALAVVSVDRPAAAQGRLADTPTHAVEEFMRAASDSNLTRMAELFGNSRGPAARTGNPKDFGKRMVVMQAYLAGISVRTLGEVRTNKADQRIITTEISRGPCKVTLPVVAMKSGSGWLVNQFDLSLAGEVNKPCEGSGNRGNPGR